MNTCPHCGAEPCLPLWRKLCLGPSSHTRCRVCGCRVGVNVAKACLAMLPGFLVVVVAGLGLVRDPVTLVVLAVVCLSSVFILYAVWVPLMPDELTTPRMVEAGRARVAAEKQQRQSG